MFLPYPKIHRLGKEETDGILEGIVTVQEKIDGANISIWFDNGVLKYGTRTRELPADESFNGFAEAVKSNKGFQEIAHEGTDTHLRFYGEWLVKHTITYPDTAYRKIYLFDVWDDLHDEFLSQHRVQMWAEELGLEYPHVFVEDERVTESQIKEFVGKTGVPEAANGEGVVIKSTTFRDKWGNHCYAKVVHEQFKEANAIVFGGNNKHSDSYHEMYIVNKYCTLGRVQKIMMKLQAETDHRLDMKETPEIAGRCLHDMITEEAWEIFNKGQVLDNKKLKSFATRKFIQIYHDVLNNTISVADGGADAKRSEGGDSSPDAGVDKA